MMSSSFLRLFAALFATLLCSITKVDARLGDYDERYLQEDDDSQWRDDDGKLHWWTYVFVVIIFVFVCSVGSCVYCFCFMARKSVGGRGGRDDRNNPRTRGMKEDEEVELTQKSAGSSDSDLSKEERRSARKASARGLESQGSMKKSKKERSSRTMARELESEGSTKKSKKKKSSRTIARELESEGSMKRSKSERSMKKKAKKERSSRNVSSSRSVEPQGKSSRDADWDRGDDDDETARLKAARKAERKEEKRLLKQQEKDEEKARQKRIRKAEKKEAKRRASQE